MAIDNNDTSGGCTFTFNNSAGFEGMRVSVTLEETAGGVVSVVADGATEVITLGEVLEYQFQGGTWKRRNAPAGPRWDVTLCGNLANNGTNYLSPVTGFPLANTATDYAMGGTACDGEDNATEGTADEVILSGNAFYLRGLYCEVSSSGANGVTLTARSATAALSPTNAMTIPTGSTSGAVITAPPQIAAGATFAVQAVTTEDLSAQDAWCRATVEVIP